MDYQTLNLLFKSGQDFGHKKIRNHGLSETECLICSYVYHNPGCFQDNVVQSLRMDKTTAARALMTLEEKQLVKRETNPLDRRKKILTVTETGEERLSAIIHVHDEWLTRVMSALSPEEQAQFEALCVRLLNAAENARSAEGA